MTAADILKFVDDLYATTALGDFSPRWGIKPMPSVKIPPHVPPNLSVMNRKAISGEIVLAVTTPVW